MNVNKIYDLKKAIAKIISESADYPQVIILNRGIEYTKFKITIEEIEEDFFVDSKGVKWIKAKDEKQINDDL